jgi:hypothetical protein
MVPGAGTGPVGHVGGNVPPGAGSLASPIASEPSVLSLAR